MGSRNMIAEIREEKLVRHSSLIEALGLAETLRPRIGAIGAGGKTTLLKRLASEYQALGQKSVITTTTHMSQEDSPQFLMDPTLEEILEIREREGFVLAGRKAANGKIKGLSPELLEEILKLPCPILIEADGARRLPVKIPGEQEPVLLPQITCVLSVYGLDGVGGRIREVCFRTEQMAQFLHKDPEDRLEARDVALLALSSRAGRKGLLDSSQYVVVLNKADTEERRELALDIGSYMQEILQKIKKERKNHQPRDIRLVVTSVCQSIRDLA